MNANVPKLWLQCGLMESIYLFILVIPYELKIKEKMAVMAFRATCGTKALLWHRFNLFEDSSSPTTLLMLNVT